MTTDERLECLIGELARSRRNCRLFLLTGIVVVAGVALIRPLGSQEAKEPKTVRAERFELLDDKGRVRGVLGMKGESALLLLADEKAQSRCSLSATKDGSGLTLSDEHGKGDLHLVTGKEGSAIVLEDANGKSRLEISVLRDAPEVWLSDADQNARAILRVGKDGPGLRLIENKAEIWSTRK